MHQDEGKYKIFLSFEHNFLLVVEQYFSLIIYNENLNFYLYICIKCVLKKKEIFTLYFMISTFINNKNYRLGRNSMNIVKIVNFKSYYIIYHQFLT
jgi:hypothetical protein